MEAWKKQYGIEVVSNLLVETAWTSELLGENKECHHFAFTWDAPMEREEKEDFIELRFSIPQVDIMHMWHPACGLKRDLRVDWEDVWETMGAVSAPVNCLFNENGRSRLTLAVSEISQTVQFQIGVHEEDGTLLIRIRIPITLFIENGSYSIQLYRDFSDCRYEDALDAVRAWWEAVCEIQPLSVPETATLPMYSSWYAHHQHLQAEEIERDCAEAVKMGMESIILDDGWQTDDENRGYAYCGDWQVTKKRFPDMAEHIKRIHVMGMKYLVWLSVPFVGPHAKYWEQFADKLLTFSGSWQAGVLDPRYPEVREYLIETYKRVVTEWNLDGLKLDFIDQFYARNDSPRYREGMDHLDVQAAVNRLMLDVADALKTVNPDIMIEFRQRYIGPNMRRFGNMFRVADCPGNLLANRVGMVDLRLLSGDTAVHSDMLLWHKEETCENAALQILNVLFSVIQFSVRPENLSMEQKEMVTFWLDFARKNREVLLHGKLRAECPHMLYPMVYAEKESRVIAAVYQPNYLIIIDVKDLKELTIVNATSTETVYLQLPAKKAVYYVETRDCRGRLVENRMMPLAGLTARKVPKSGLVKIKAVS